ncbi:glycoside hydrolase family protein [Natrialba magadii ATCC 43099]|uniref:Alpha amylase n=1 Tax=Natrialba magadii (strain ATCC 43099 / DSM 3394 / CCM 3739 / CIP 104546 / IAM 13178 / JCM 8861 / NBRC 102185 / NCIMB 2190 / MS3) TaxID=547559 RepID=D3SRN3_NATMM|nr:alpha-amylase family glycosyl hydrolase [Natrialba magadii]ADD04738.1 glycoside hydrolase family protein [Natrialba magadii ATCC 43099]ELY24905.1 alpha amylase [Natrialba magadii ATCC 43099]
MARENTDRLESGNGSHHPGPPRFVTVGEGLVNPNGHEMETRDELAPWNLDRNPDGDYAWHVADAPEGSTATPTDAPIAEFVPDVPGEYTLVLEAPDGEHELTVRAFPQQADEGRDEQLRPQVRLETTVDTEQDREQGQNQNQNQDPDRIQFDATANLAGSDATADDDDETQTDLTVEYYVDDRSALELDDRNGIRIAELEGLEYPVCVYAVAVTDDGRYSIPDAVKLDSAADADGVQLERPFEPPTWVEDAIIYEIFTRRFPDQDDPTFETIADRVDHLADLGIDVLWLTPMLETDRGFGTPDSQGGPHGYHTDDYLQVDPDLGSIADFEALVETCHDHDIRVVFDLVINHTGDTHPFYEAAVDDSHPEHERYRDWYRWESFDERDADTYFGWEGIPNLDHSNPAVRAYLLEVIDFWAPLVDGFRTDVAWGVPLGFWTEVSDRLRRYDAEFFLLDETIPSDVEMGGGRFHMHHDDVLHDTLESVAAAAVSRDAGDDADRVEGRGRGEGEDDEAEDEEAETENNDTDTEDAVADTFSDMSVDASDGARAILDAVAERARRGAHPDSEWLLYVENHDTDRFLTEHGRDAQRAAAAATFTLPGSPMLYYGQETGLTERREPMNWGSFETEVLEYYHQLIDLRQSVPALQRAAALERVAYETPTKHAVVYARDASTADRAVQADQADTEDGPQRVLVVLNFSPEPTTVRVSERVSGQDLLSGAQVVSESDGGDPEWDRAVTVDSAVVLESTGSSME